MTQLADRASGTRPPRHRLRSVAAVLGGFLVIVIVSTVTDSALHAVGVFPRAGQAMAGGLWLLATAYRIMYSIAGCYVAAQLAPNRPMRHAMALGVVGFLVGLAGLLVTWGKGPAFGPVWYPMALVAIALPCGWAGGRLAEMRDASSSK